MLLKSVSQIDKTCLNVSKVDQRDTCFICIIVTCNKKMGFFSNPKTKKTEQVSESLLKQDRKTAHQ